MSVQDGAATGRKLVELVVFVSVCGSGLQGTVFVGLDRIQVFAY